MMISASGLSSGSQKSSPAIAERALESPRIPSTVHSGTKHTNNFGLNLTFTNRLSRLRAIPQSLPASRPGPDEKKYYRLAPAISQENIYRLSAKTLQRVDYGVVCIEDDGSRPPDPSLNSDGRSPTLASRNHICNRLQLVGIDQKLGCTRWQPQDSSDAITDARTAWLRNRTQLDLPAASHFSRPLPTSSLPFQKTSSRPEAAQALHPRTRDHHCRISRALRAALDNPDSLGRSFEPCSHPRRPRLTSQSRLSPTLFAGSLPRPAAADHSPR
jgi:hypothetical protein